MVRSSISRLMIIAAVLTTGTSAAQVREPARSGGLELNAQSVQLRPNESFQFQVGRTECCYVFKPAAARVAWSIEPPQGASIDRATGLIRVAATATPGATFTVSARVENSDSVVKAIVTVYTRATHPLVGLWRQGGWKPCTPIARMTPDMVDPPIRELEFRADGTFSVTWQPFERYKDYWGTYRYSPATHALALTIEHGNFVPNDFSGQGAAIVSGDTLSLRGVQLGTKQAHTRPRMCELAFVRT